MKPNQKAPPATHFVAGLLHLLLLRKTKEDHDITEIGREVQMPWQSDGRRWHTVDRVGRTGNPCRWDGRILAEVVDRIQEKSDLLRS